MGRRSSKRLSAGAVDYGYTGDAPPVFAEAKHAAIRYVGFRRAATERLAVLVTHDVAEAVALADRIVTIDQGAIALGVPVAAHPRHRGAREFGALEGRILDRLLGAGETRGGRAAVQRGGYHRLSQV